MGVSARDALIVVDLQPDFMPGGALAVGEGDQIAKPIGELASRFQTVVATQDWHPSGHVSFSIWPPHCVQGSAGARLHEALPDAAISLILRKGTRADVDSYSAFRENAGADGTRASTGLGAWLKARGIERVFVVGLARDYCVKATALDAAADGFETFVVDDLTRAVAPAEHAAVDRAFADGHVKRIHSREVA
jgi:nicotinamidase/pyrazinamidase